MDGAPKVNSGGAGPVTSVRGEPVTGVASADAAEVRASRVDVDEKDGLALQGYDCVSYHAPGAVAPLRGIPEHVVHTENVLQGRVRYLFATAENAERFRREHVSQTHPPTAASAPRASRAASSSALTPTSGASQTTGASSSSAARRCARRGRGGVDRPSSRCGLRLAQTRRGGDSRAAAA